MRFPIGLIIILISQKILIRIFSGEPVSLLNGAIRSKAIRRQYNPGSSGPQNAFALLTGIFSHSQSKLIAFNSTDHGKTDPCIAAGGLNNRFIMGQQS